MRYALTTLGLLLAAACSAGTTTTTTGSGTYALKCQAACVPPTGPCGTQDPASCQSSCVATTEGLTITCAQCIVESSGWYGTKCDGVNQCSFGPGSNTCSGGTGSTCSAAQEKCDGFKLGKSTSSTCSAACKPE